MKTCEDARSEYPDEFPGCCTSCHEDSDYGYELCGGWGILSEWSVCCRVAEFLEKKLSEQIHIKIGGVL
jgi:hypothetical protein